MDWIHVPQGAYIDTGYKLNRQSCLEFQYLQILSGWSWGIVYQNNTNGMWVAANSDRVFLGRYTTESWGTSVNGYLKYDIPNGLATLRYRGGTQYSTSISLLDSVFPDVAMRLGDAYDKAMQIFEEKGGAFRMGRCLISENGTSKIDFNPCLYKGEYGLWDTINNKFYGNSGTGTITGGYD